MKLSAAFSILLQLRSAIWAGFMPTLSAIVRTPSLLWHPTHLSRTFMAHVWKVYGNGADVRGRPAKQALLPENATGVVLDIGAGKLSQTCCLITNGPLTNIAHPL